MSAACPVPDSSIAAYRRDDVSEPERRALRAHLSACPACRDRAIAADATLIFGLAPAQAPADDGDARRVLENVRAALAMRTASRKIERGHARHGLRAAAVVAAAALLALTSSAPRRPLAATASEAPRPRNGFQNAATKIVRPGGDDSPSMPSSATIYEWNPGSASPDDPKIVWIVDRSLDL
jgi:anti-sigma factor RsiW